ncbi:MAG: DMT family transporter, partial [Solirubrobacterales bacterium]
LLIAAGEQRVASSLAAILIASMPLMVALLSPEDRPTGLRLVGLVVGFGGVVALLGLDVAGRAGELLGAVLILVATLCYATATIIVNRGLADLDPLGPIAASLALATLGLLPAVALAPPGGVPSAEALGAAVLLPVAWRRGALRGLGGRWRAVAAYAACEVALPFLLIAAGEQEISSSLAGILVTSTPLFTALLAIWIDHEERSQGMRLVGVLLGVAGVAVLLGVDLGGSGDLLLGGFAVVLAGLGYAIGAFTVKHRLAGRPAIGGAAWACVAATVLLAPIAAIGAPTHAPALGPVAAVAVLGIVGTGIAFVILYHLIGVVGPARTWIVTYLAPGFAVVYGAVLLDERISVATVAGLVLILGGSWLAAEGRIPFVRGAVAGEAGAAPSERAPARTGALARPQER